MPNEIEYRTVVCKYANEYWTIESYKYFGWKLTQKTLLNRFGNPLLDTTGINEDDLIEKCSWKLDFVRVVDNSKVMELTTLQNEFNALAPLDNSFGKGRIVGSVWLSIFSFTCIILGSVWLGTPSSALAIALLVMGIVLFGVPIIVIFTTGFSKIARTNKENERRLKERTKIAQKAQDILKEEKKAQKSDLASQLKSALKNANY